MATTEHGGIAAYHPFTRLQGLLDHVPPGRSPLPDGRAINLALGEPQRPAPAMVADSLADAVAGWSRYPPARGTPAYREAAVRWLTRRFRLPADLLDAERHVLPLPGTREGLFFAALAFAPPSGPRPAVLLPNPFYHVYAGATLAAGAEPVFVPCTRETGFLPRFETLPEDTLRRAALAYVSSPSNPQGAVADLGRLVDMLTLARRFEFNVAFDECYSEIYMRTPPPSALQAAETLGGSLDRLLVFHSLSKRSSAPGLRCGFAAGDEHLVARLDHALRVGGTGVPLPVLAAGARLWGDEAHVDAMRRHYRRAFALAEDALSETFGFQAPNGAFFVWLEVGDGEAATLRLWREAGIRVLPGAYMGVPDATGANPASPFIRIALVHDEETITAALSRLVEVLEGAGAGAV